LRDTIPAAGEYAKQNGNRPHGEKRKGGTIQLEWRFGAEDGMVIY